MSMPHTCRCGICGLEMSPQFIAPQGEIVNPHVLPHIPCKHVWSDSPDVPDYQRHCVCCFASDASADAK
jgi:hypothetical protein